MRATLMLAVVGALVSALPAPAAAPKWVRQVLESAPQSPPTECGLVVLLERSDVRVNARLEAQTHLRRVLRIQDTDGARGAVLELNLEPGASVLDAQAWTIRAGDVVAEVDRAQVAERNLTSEGYADARIANLRAADVKVGDAVAFDVTWAQVQPFPSYWWLPQQSAAPVRRAELELELPAHWSATPFKFATNATLPTAPGNRVALALNDLPELSEEPYSLGNRETLPRVFVRFDAPSAEKTLDTWDKIAGWYSRASAPSLGADACPRELRISGADTDVRQDLDYIARSVQQKVRYVAVELGMQRWIPDRADATWNRRYGDCKDKAALLACALAARGIQSRLVLVRVRSEGDLELESPDPGQFNHCVVAIGWSGDSTLAAATVTSRSGKRWIIFDPTDEVLPLGAIPTAIGGAAALIADPAEGLVKLPEATPSKINIDVVGHLSESGTLTGQLRFWVEGPQSQEVFGAMVSISSVERQRRARRALTQRWPTAHMDTCRAVFRGARDRGAGFAIDFTLPAAAYSGSGAWILAGDFYSGEDGIPPTDSLRRTSVVLGEPGTSVESWDVTLPSGWKLEPTQSVQWHSAEGDYVAEFSNAGDHLHLERRFELRTRSLTAARYPEAVRFLKTIYSGDHCPLLIDQR